MTRWLCSLALVLGCNVETDGVAEITGFSWRAGARCDGDSETMVVGKERELEGGWTCMAEPSEHLAGYETMAVQCWREDVELRFLTSCEGEQGFGHAELELGGCSIAVQCRR